MTLGIFSVTKKGSNSDLTITGADTLVCDAVTGLTGMQSLGFALRFAYGSGGATIKAYLQSSLDQGTTWFDIACIAFAMANRSVLLNFNANTPKLVQVVPGDGALADDTATDGLLGDRVRLKAIVTGTYAGNSLLVGRICAR